MSSGANLIFDEILGKNNLINITKLQNKSNNLDEKEKEHIQNCLHLAFESVITKKCDLKQQIGYIYDYITRSQENFLTFCDLFKISQSFVENTNRINLLPREFILIFNNFLNVIVPNLNTYQISSQDFDLYKDTPELRPYLLAYHHTWIQIITNTYKITLNENETKFNDGSDTVLITYFNNEYYGLTYDSKHSKGREITPISYSNAPNITHSSHLVFSSLPDFVKQLQGRNPPTIYSENQDVPFVTNSQNNVSDIQFDEF